MKKVEKIIKIIKKILTDRVETTEPGIFHKYVGAIDRENILKSAKAFGTPQYLLDQDELERKANFFIQTFREALPTAEFFYAFKCNDFPALISTVKKAGFNADVAGLFELELALKLGFDKIMFSGPGKSEEELQMAINNKDKVIINIDNVDELLRLKKLVAKANGKNKINGGKENSEKANGEKSNGEKGNGKVRISFRLNSDNALTKEWAKFGIHLTDFRKAYEMIANDEHFSWIGLHFHASGNQTPERYVKNIKLIGEYLKANFSEQELSKLEFLDIGGGFYPEDQALLTKVSEKGSIHEAIEDYSNNHNQQYGFDPYEFFLLKTAPLGVFAKKIAFYLKKYILSLNPNVILFTEPGRYIATHSTTILLKVVAAKQDCVIVDGGINMLGDYRFNEYAFPIIVNVSRPSHKFNRKIIYGSLCDPSDIWGYSYFGDSLRKGDVLAILHQGAYTFSCSWRFIKPTPPYVVLSKEELSLGKKQEAFYDRYAGCKIENEVFDQEEESSED